jgi:hypothetical protein
MLGTEGHLGGWPLIICGLGIPGASNLPGGQQRPTILLCHTVELDQSNRE